MMPSTRIDDLIAVSDARKRAARGSHAPRTQNGPREDAEPTNDLPTLRLSDPTTRLPRACPRGRGHLLEPELPVGYTKPGSISCVTCGRTLVWLRP